MGREVTGSCHGNKINSITQTQKWSIIALPVVMLSTVILLVQYSTPPYTAVPYIEVIQFWIPPTPREIRLKKLNVSPTLYCNVLSLTVYFIGMLMYRQNHDLNSHSSPYLIPE